MVAAGAHTAVSAGDRAISVKDSESLPRLRFFGDYWLHRHGRGD
jgi:hypothetical protein